MPQELQFESHLKKICIINFDPNNASYKATYIGETGRNLSARLTEHKHLRELVTSTITEHHLETKDQLHWDSALCITYSIDYYQRLHFRKLVY